ncbi:SseB family protein [Microbispora sp. SCL1-1]|uniref:SseB family protein n=2 Tax=Streptosporangiaceae TaxID=2004 RepID=A0ABZ1SVZ2_9ACTN|nr:MULTISPECIES: SAV_915 family protein [Microbispora]NJP25214.1 SseB family protein [Microbispora sp. CL1-1]TQS13671.1 SseB family protein [Microbispora sp. SCL1-1]
MTMLEDPLYVPVRRSSFSLALRLFRTAAGTRTAVAFTSPLRLTKVLGSDHGWVRLSEPALRSMLKDLGVIGIVIDPAGLMSRPNSRTA